MEAATVVHGGGLARAAVLALMGLVVAACAPAASPPGAERTAAEGAGAAASGSGTSGGELASPAPPYVPAGSRETVDKRLAVTSGGQTTYIKNGGQVVLGDGLVAEIYLDPYPPSALRSTMDVYVTRDGHPLADGGVQIDYEMLAMAHGPFSAEAKKIGGGHYLVSLDYIMFGPWEQVVTIRIGLQRIRLPVLIVAYP